MPTTHDGDLDALLAEPPRPGGKECATGWTLQRLDPDDAAKVRTILARGITREIARDLAAAFVRRGYPSAGVGSIVRHANGGCRNCAERTT